MFPKNTQNANVGWVAEATEIHTEKTQNKQTYRKAHTKISIAVYTRLKDTS